MHLKFWYVLWKVSLCNQPSAKILGADPLMGFSGQKHHRHVALFLLLEGKCTLCDLSQEREQEEANMWIPRLCRSLPYDAGVYPYYMTIYICIMSTNICWVLWVLLANFQMWVGLENSNTYLQRVKGLNLYQNGINSTTTMTNNSKHL